MSTWKLEKFSISSAPCQGGASQEKWDTRENGNFLLKYNKDSGVLTVEDEEKILHLWDFTQHYQSIKVYRQHSSLLLLKKSRNTVYMCRLFFEGEEGDTKSKCCYETLESFLSRSPGGLSKEGSSKMAMNFPTPKDVFSEPQELSESSSPSLLQEAEDNPLETFPQYKKLSASRKVLSISNSVLNSSSAKYAGGEEAREGASIITTRGVRRMESLFTTNSENQGRSRPPILVSGSSEGPFQIASTSKGEILKFPPDVVALPLGLQEEEDVIELPSSVSTVKRKKGRRRGRKTSPGGKETMIRRSLFTSGPIQESLVSASDSEVKRLVTECLCDPHFPELVTKIHRIMSNY